MTATSRRTRAMPAIVAIARLIPTGPSADAGPLPTNRRPAHLPVVR
jgi:hypothetical protein